MFNRLFNILRMRRSRKAASQPNIGEENPSPSGPVEVGLPAAPSMERRSLPVGRLAQRVLSRGTVARRISRVARGAVNPVVGPTGPRGLPMVRARSSWSTANRPTRMWQRGFGVNPGSGVILSPRLDGRAPFSPTWARRDRPIRSPDLDQGSGNSLAPAFGAYNSLPEESQAPTSAFTSLRRSVLGRANPRPARYRDSAPVDYDLTAVPSAWPHASEIPAGPHPSRVPDPSNVRNSMALELTGQTHAAKHRLGSPLGHHLSATSW